MLSRRGTQRRLCHKCIRLSKCFTLVIAGEHESSRIWRACIDHFPKTLGLLALNFRKTYQTFFWYPFGYFNNLERAAFSVVLALSKAPGWRGVGEDFGGDHLIFRTPEGGSVVRVEKGGPLNFIETWWTFGSLIKKELCSFRSLGMVR